MQLRVHRHDSPPPAPRSPATAGTVRRQQGARAKFMLTLVRGLLVLALGLALLLGSSRAPHQIANFIGVYILCNALVTFRWWLAHDHKSALTGLAGVLGLLAGVTILGRGLLARAMPPEAALQVVGLLILLTGWTCVVGGFVPATSEHPLPLLERYVLGGFELLLGVLFVIFPPWVGRPEHYPLLTGLLAGWSLVAGLTLLADGLRQRTQLRAREAQPALAEPDTDGSGRGAAG
jgi:uncharacterized membrane protein HdeD (DUF308 family)